MSRRIMYCVGAVACVAAVVWGAEASNGSRQSEQMVDGTLMARALIVGANASGSPQTTEVRGRTVGKDVRISIGNAVLEADEVEIVHDTSGEASSYVLRGQVRLRARLKVAEAP